VDYQLARRIALLAGQGTVLMLYLQYMLEHPGVGEGRAAQAFSAAGVLVGLVFAYGSLMLGNRPKLAATFEWVSIAIFVAFVVTALLEWPSARLGQSALATVVQSASISSSS
jgi:hypothetical protein